MLSLPNKDVFTKSAAEPHIDLLVEFEPGKKTFDNFMNLSFYLKELLGRKADMVICD